MSLFVQWIAEQPKFFWNNFKLNCKYSCQDFCVRLLERMVRANEHEDTHRQRDVHPRPKLPSTSQVGTPVGRRLPEAFRIEQQIHQPTEVGTDLLRRNFGSLEFFFKASMSEPAKHNPCGRRIFWAREVQLREDWQNDGRQDDHESRDKHRISSPSLQTTHVQLTKFKKFIFQVHSEGLKQLSFLLKMIKSQGSQNKWSKNH